MGFVITVDVECDQEGCLDWIHGATGHRAMGREARERAAAHGWTQRRRPDGTKRDLCPRHSADRLASEDETDG